jgi:hypothetical protein
MLQYALILVVLLILKMVLVIMAFNMNFDTIVRHIYIPVEQYVVDPEVEAEIDLMQVSVS